MAFRYLSRVLYPLLFCYSIYSLMYREHKVVAKVVASCGRIHACSSLVQSWYSFVVSTLAGCVYTFGFIAMTPQLFINYKLKSVAHMPWRMMTYKALNTFIDDLFAFIIRMPMVGCLTRVKSQIRKKKENERGKRNKRKELKEKEGKAGRRKKWKQKERKKKESRKTKYRRSKRARCSDLGCRAFHFGGMARANWHRHLGISSVSRSHANMSFILLTLFFPRLPMFACFLFYSRCTGWRASAMTWCFSFSCTSAGSTGWTTRAATNLASPGKQQRRKKKEERGVGEEKKIRRNKRERKKKKKKKGREGGGRNKEEEEEEEGRRRRRR